MFYSLPVLAAHTHVHSCVESGPHVWSILVAAHVVTYAQVQRQAAVTFTGQSDIG